MNMQDEKLSITDHLTELRKRIIWIVAVLLIATIGGFFLAFPILDLLKNVGAAKDLTWNALSPWDAFRVYMQVAFFIAVGVTLPITLYHIWAFVQPGLRVEERRAALKYIPFSVLLFLLGLSFAYFVIFQLALKFTLSLNRSLNLTEVYGVAQYFSFMMNILLPIAALFEMPVLIMFLTRIRLLNPLRLRKLRRYAYMVLVVLSTLIAPPDLISNVLILIPLIGLYEISVIFSKKVYGKQLERDQAWEAEYGPK